MSLLFEEESVTGDPVTLTSKKTEDKIDSAYESNLKNSLWVEKYRPRRLSEYVGNEQFKQRIQKQIESGDINNLLLAGTSGVGKTTIAKMVANSVNCDLLYINASDENGIDTIREKVSMFASSVGFNDLKIIIMDEFSEMTMAAQNALRATMETYSTHTRFILTCNAVERVHPAIISRCGQPEKVFPPNKAHIAKHLASILNKEGVSFELKDIATIVNAHYPDIRKIIGTAQQFSNVDKVLKLDEEAIVDSNIHLKIVEILKSKSNTSFVDIRQIIADSGIYNFDTHYKYLFETVDSWSNGNVSECILILAEMQYKSTTVPDREINFMSCIIQLLEKIGEK